MFCLQGVDGENGVTLLDCQGSHGTFVFVRLALDPKLDHFPEDDKVHQQLYYPAKDVLLVYPDHNLEFNIKTNASNNQFGAVIL